MGGLSVPQLLSYIEAMDFCEWLTKRFRGKLPNNYIVRLPTEAEWEYAFRLNDSEKGSPYFDWERNLDQIAVRVKEIRKRAASMKFDIDSISDPELFPIEVGTKQPNGLGLFDMLGNGYQIMLDTVDKYSVTACNLLNGHNSTTLVYDDKEIDPLRFSKGMIGLKLCLTRGSLWNTHSPFLPAKYLIPLDLRGARCQKYCVRLCIGPDLMKEKGYKFKLQKKK